VTGVTTRRRIVKPKGVELIELHGREKGIEIGESQTGETTHLGYSCKTVSENTFPILELIVLWHGLFT
jgi:hypothetical protein